MAMEVKKCQMVSKPMNGQRQIEKQKELISEEVFKKFANS
jgi:hypothetical protein